MRLAWEFKRHINGDTLLMDPRIGLHPIMIVVDMAGGRHTVFNDATKEVLGRYWTLETAKKHARKHAREYLAQKKTA
jgi:hypothetical protein